MKPDDCPLPIIRESPSAKRIALINSIIARNDAVSASVRDTYHILASDLPLRVAVFTYRNDFSDVPCHIVKDTAELLLHPAYLDADLIIWHVGAYYELFNAALIGNGKARQLVRYHNTTPKQLLPESFWPDVERALHQRHHLRYVDEVWCDSVINGEVAQAAGVAKDRIRVIPLPVDAPVLSTLAEKARASIDILFVGRFVKSKGVSELIEALAHLPRGRMPLRLTLAGNMEYSDPSYVNKLRNQIAARGLSQDVAWLGTVDDAMLEKLYREAHILAIPSYHEGFCKPVIEGLRAGCIPVGYASYNLPYIANKLGRLVPTGDVAALTDALDEVMKALAVGLAEPEEPCLPLDCGRLSVAEFDRASRDYVQRFMCAQVSGEMLSRVRRLLNRRGRLWYNIRPNFLVVDDDAMRERTRLSLNRIPDITDWEPGGPLSDRMHELDEPVTIHRKSWEYAICVEGMHRFGQVKPDAQAIAVGAGSERPLFYFANHIARMVATDLYDNPQHEGTPAMLTNPESFAPFPYRADHLQVLRMPGDRLEFADDTFDFAFCLSSIEHFGSRESQRRSLAEMARVVRPGGLLCVITELILTDHSHHEYFRWEEIEDIFLSCRSLELVGGDPDLSISDSLVRFPVDLDNSKHLAKSPHIVLKKGEMLWTSFSMFLRRVG